MNRNGVAWKGGFLLAGLGAGCAPAYRPPTAFVPLLREQGDGQIALHLGLGGAQLDGAYAATGGLAVRTGVQVAGYVGEGAYTVGTLGAGAYGSSNHTAWGVSVIGGGGYARGITEIGVNTPTISGGTDHAEVGWRNSGSLATGALRAEIGTHLGENGALGANLGPTWHVLAHDAESDDTGSDQMVMLETAGVARGGVAPVMFEGSLGIAYPLWIAKGEGRVASLPFPVRLGIGLTFDL